MDDIWAGYCADGANALNRVRVLEDKIDELEKTLRMLVKGHDDLCKIVARMQATQNRIK